MDDLSGGAFSCAGQSGEGITVTIGANVTKIPAKLFAGSSSYAPNIISVVFEDNSLCTSIGSYAFYYCSSLISITVPSKVTTIGSYAFAYCSSLTSATFESPSGWYYTYNDGDTDRVVTFVNLSSAASYLTNFTYYKYDWYRSDS